MLNTMTIGHRSAVAALDVRLHIYVQLVSVVVLWYDHIMTLPQEISGIWLRKKTLISWLYLINRYLATFGNAVFFAFVFKTLSSGLLLFANQLLICVILLIRVYAIYARDIRILVVFIGIGVITTALTGFALVHQDSKPLVGYPGCILQRTEESAIRVAIPWECVLVYDILVMVLTIGKTFKSRRASHSKRTSGMGLDIASLIFRDGAIAMSFLNILNILAFYITPPLLRGSLSIFVSVMGVSLVSRVVLNLREAAVTEPPPHQTSQWLSHPEAVSHMNSMGNFELLSMNAHGPANMSPLVSYGWQASTAGDPFPIIEVMHVQRPMPKSLVV
ncbi:hypothetical protein FIBSPDRAFT_1042479 [Athelia psychrophila]|uniref:DUF6533 domain-containing protein n=1 Tax=Athelia psychrophila TaxID=1759441 RepID=A0A166ME95_9AGAM|nr:hypothetical protein FIBSPDRAFT_1042479 [Fibularhizoctonia sp. CBS 109695]